MEDEEGTVKEPIGIPDETQVERWILPEDDGGYMSVTEFETLEKIYNKHYMVYGNDERPELKNEVEIPGYSLVKLRLLTGRTHQIRVHMAYLGHPVVGDHLYCHGDPFKYREIYGNPKGRETNPEIVSDLINRQALHAYELSFLHPVTGENMTLNADIPEDIRNAINLAKEEKR